MRKVIVLGGGFGGVSGAQHLSKDKSADVLIISRTNFQTYTPFLADVAGGTIAVMHAVPPVRMMAPKAELEVAEVESVDIAGQKVRVRLSDQTRQERPFDALVVALGAVTSFEHGAGAAEFGFPLSTPTDAFVLRNHVLEMLGLAEVTTDSEKRRELLTFVFVGGGFSGVEGAAAIQDLAHEATRYLKNVRPNQLRFVLAPHGERLLAQIDEKLGDYAAKRLSRRGIDVRLGVGVSEVMLRSATLTTGEVIPTRTVLWAAGTQVNPLVDEMDLPLDQHGAIEVNGTLQVNGHENVYALGDCAAVPLTDGSGSYAPTAQNAIREGSVAAHNLLAHLRGETPDLVFDYKPVGTLASLGHREAVAQIKGLRLAGLPAWFMWRGIYLGKLPGFARKFQVGVDWIGDLLNPVETTYFPLGHIVESRFHRAEQLHDLGAAEPPPAPPEDESGN